MKLEIEACRDGNITKDEVKDNKDILINQVNHESEILRKKLKEYNKDELWKIKYENKKRK